MTTTATPTPTAAPLDAGTGRLGPLAVLRVVRGAAYASGATRLKTSGVLFYLMVWTAFPLFNLFLVTLVYRNDPQLRAYAIVAGAGMALLFSMQFNAGEILDGERRRGTLGNLFVSPAPRYSWLAGFQLVAIAESMFTAILSVAIGKAVFGLPLHVNGWSLAISLLLFIAAMWGFSMLIGALGVALRNANQLSNLVFPLIQLVAGTMYPIVRTPDWVKIPAHCLPFGYAIQALSDSLTQGSTPGQLADQLWPLAGFAIVLPIIGVVAFRAVERRTRVAGTLELV